jgi:ankyrin repeat protein
MHHAAALGNGAGLSLLLDAGANIRLQDNRGATALHVVNVLWPDDLRALDFLISHGLHVSDVDNFGRTPLHYAALGGRKCAVSALLRRGAHLHAVDSKGMTPLHLVMQAKAKDLDIEIDMIGTMKRLLRAGADPNALSVDGHTPLQLAIASGNTERAKIFQDHGKVPVLLRNDKTRTPLVT